MQQNGVSPVIATVLLIVVTVLLVSMVAVIATGLVGTVPTPVNVNLMLENASSGYENFTIYHMGGDNIKDAINGKSWNNLIVRVNGQNATIVSYNGDNNPQGMITLSAGDVLYVQAPKPLAFGDVITIVYKPANQILRYIRVT